jgi:hypothetical protein
MPRINPNLNLDQEIAKEMSARYLLRLIRVYDLLEYQDSHPSLAIIYL